MFQQLLQIYNQSCTNPSQPECAWAETIVFNEGWLLRGVVQKWRQMTSPGRFDFLPFPQGVCVYSEARLYTPFMARFHGDKLAEGPTHVDGIVGDFKITGSKSGIALLPDWETLTVLEAKMYSPLSGGVKYAPGYDQVSRTVACTIHTMLQAGDVGDRLVRLVVLHPADNKHIQPGHYTLDQVEGRIEKRIESYLAADPHGKPLPRFFAEWRTVLPHIRIQFVTWEEVAGEIDSDDLKHFYALCVQFNYF